MTQDGAPARHAKPEILAIKFVQAMDRTDDVAVVQQSFQDVVLQLGFSSVTCATIPFGRHLDPGCLLMSTHPADWSEDYFDRAYPKHDPVLREIIRGRNVVDWPHAFKNRKLSKRETEILEHRRAHGMPFGIAMLIPGVEGNIG